MQPFRTVLFAADFSENSQEAFGAACSLAIGNDTKLVVLHVAEPNWIPEQPVYYGQQMVQFFAAEPDKARHEALVRKLREVYTFDRPVELEYQTTEGDVSTEILRVATAIRSDVIVMGTHGRTGLRWLVAGSVAVAVLHGAQCPVLAFRNAQHPRPCKEIRIILHPTDFSVDSEAALRTARGLARDHGARLIILHVEMLEILMDGTPAADFDSHADRDALETLRQRVAGPDLKHPVEIVFRRGDAAQVIVETAEETGCDLIVMGTHGRTGLHRLLMGSVAEGVLPKANCPVIIVKAPRHDSGPISEQPAGAVMAAV